MDVAVKRSNKAAGRRGALFRGDLRHGQAADAGHGVIAPCQAKPSSAAAAPSRRPDASNTNTLAPALSTIANGSFWLSPESTIQSATCRASREAGSRSKLARCGRLAAGTATSSANAIPAAVASKPAISPAASLVAILPTGRALSCGLACARAPAARRSAAVPAAARSRGSRGSREPPLAARSPVERAAE